MNQVLYSATSTAWGGRNGRVTSTDGRIDLQLSMPKSIGGDDGAGTNPEQLFATGYAACFHSALKLVAGRQHVDVSESAVSVTVDLISDGSGFGIGAKIEAELPGVDAQTGRQLIEAAHEVCPYSKATRGNIPVELAVVDG
jgi:osmotically inducible protein OsmC